VSDATPTNLPGPAKPPRVLFLTFAADRSNENQGPFARGISRMLAHDFNRTEPGVAAAALLTARRADVKGFVLPQVPSEPGPMVALGEQLGVHWVVQGFSRVTPEGVDFQIQWVDAVKRQVSAVQRFSGKREELGKVLDQVRKAAATAFAVGPAPSMPPAVWNQTSNADALLSFLRYLDNAILLYDPADREVVGELRDPADLLTEALKVDRFFRAASDAMAAENRGEMNSFGALLEIDVDAAALL
jgi:TolB-like protein